MVRSRRFGMCASSICATRAAEGESFRRPKSRTFSGDRIETVPVSRLACHVRSMSVDGAEASSVVVPPTLSTPVWESLPLSIRRFAAIVDVPSIKAFLSVIAESTDPK